MSRSLRSVAFLALLLLVAVVRIAAQTSATGLYWENPATLVPYRARFMDAATGGGTLAVVWQELSRQTADGGSVVLSIQTTKDARTWKTHRAFAGPITFVGKEVPLFSVAVDHQGVVYVAVALGPFSIAVYRSEDGGGSFSRVASFAPQIATVSPRIFVRQDNGLLLFVNQDVSTGAATTGSSQAAQAHGTPSIRYSTSDDGTSWSPFKAFVTETSVATALNFLPYHASFDGKDYVVFQAYVRDPVLHSLSNQLYIKISDDGGKNWTPAKRITSFDETVAGKKRTSGEFDNQNARIADLNGKLSIAWERTLDFAGSQIYFAQLSADGSVVGLPDVVTQSGRASHDPQLFSFKGTDYLTWFDDRAGYDHIILARKTSQFWREQDLSPQVAGASEFAVPVELENEIYILWENRRGADSNIIILRPDKTVTAPTIATEDFKNGGRYRKSVYTIAWNLPSDSSGISGFSASWDRNKDGKPPENSVERPPNDRTLDVTLNQDGEWYFHVAAHDFAGNWSATSTVSVYRDTTPPGTVTFIEPATDAKGYLVSNNYDVKWRPPPDKDVAEYAVSLQYLDVLGRGAEPVSFTLRSPGDIVKSPDYALSNQDNGLWALTVSAVDTVGNRGAPETLFLLLDKYIPVTYITSVLYSRDELGRNQMSIIGRGFQQGGDVSEVILDRDEKKPWDYVFSLRSGAYTVDNDRLISGLVLDEVNQGSYWVGVDHPTRGIHFAPKRVAIQPSGRVKFGDFTAIRPFGMTLWQGGRFVVPFSGIVLLILMALLGFLAVFSFQRMTLIVREGRLLQIEARALLTGEVRPAVKKERLVQMKRRGLGLRIKFSFFTIMLVISTVLIVAFPLGITMTASQEQNLAQGLSDKAKVLLGSISSAVSFYLPSQNMLQLGYLPQQRSAVSDSLYVTITGESKDPTKHPGYDYVWASDDPNILKKLDPDVQKEIEASSGQTGLVYGESVLKDQVSPGVTKLATELGAKAKAELSGLQDQLDKDRSEQRILATKATRTAADNTRIQQLSEDVRKTNTQITDALSQIANVVKSEPPYSTTSLDRGNTTYIFYKPVMYVQTGDRQYFRGVVRVGMSTNAIIHQMDAERRSLIITTGIIALIAMAIGTIAALVLATIIIIPIRTLVRGVEVIRDTEDKEELRSYSIDVRTRDEIRSLADTVNQMARGLADAAAANKDLILGKDTQKMFTPLEQDPKSGRKLTTVSEQNQFADFFGYYEGARGVSGDYFDFQKLDDRHYAIIKCDVAGKGVPASLIMVEVATVFLDYFRNWSMKTTGIHLEQLVYRINDLVESRGFKGRFAALMVVIMNVQTGVTYLCNAGDKLLHMYDSSTAKMVQKELPESPATGVFPSTMVEMGTGFRQVRLNLKKGDSLLLFTDGVEEDKRHFRTPDFEPMTCDEPGLTEGSRHENHAVGEDSEELGIPRIYNVVDAVMHGETYRLVKHHNPIPGEELVFDFSECEKTVSEAVLALAAVDKVFRLYLDPSATDQDQVRVDVKIDEFLRKYFLQYGTYFRSGTADERFPEYVYYSGLKEDYQYDDLTILGVSKK